MRRYIFFNLKTIQEYINPLKHPNISLLVVLALGFILRAFKMVRTGIWVDEGIFLYEVQMILDGKIPYRDFFKVKPLGMIYILSILFYFSGQNVIAARILTSFVGLWTCFFIYLLGKEMYNQKIGFLAAAFYTFDPLVILFSYHVYMEPYATFFVVLSAYFAVIGKKKEKIVAYLISGIFIAVSFFMKQPGIIMSIVIVFFIFYSRFQEKSMRNGFKEFLTLIIGISFFLSARSYAYARSNSPSLEEQKLVAEYILNREIKEVKDTMPFIFHQFIEYYERIKKGERDLYF